MRLAPSSADAIVQRASSAFRGLRDAQVFALVPGAIRGLGQSTGFTMELLNSGGLPRDQFDEVRDRVLAEASANPKLTSVRLSELPDVASLKVNVDQQRLAALGVGTADVNDTLATAWGGRYVDDFIDRARVKRVYVQGDAPYRSNPKDIDQWFVRNTQGGHGAFLIVRADAVDRPRRPARRVSSAIHRHSRSPARARRASVR